MRVPAFPGVAVILTGLLALAGCTSSVKLEQQADMTCQRLMEAGTGQASPTAADPAREVRAGARGEAVRSPYAGPAMPLALAGAPVAELCLAAAPSSGVEAWPHSTPSLALAGSADVLAAAEPVAPSPGVTPSATATTGEEKKTEEKKAADLYPSLDGKSAADIFKDDLRAFPGRLWNGTKLSYGNWPNMAVLSLAFGGSMIIQNNLDDRIADNVKRHSTSLRETGPWGANLGHPALHIGGALIWYGVTVAQQDAKNHEMALVLIEALTINDLSTGLLQVSVHQHDPRGDYFSWPSGHTSSSFTVASVLHEYYGWKVGVPAYIVASYIGASRIEDRRHNLSDVWFGATMGLVIGHSVARGELPQIGGFTVLPFSRDDANGLMLMKQW